MLRRLRRKPKPEPLTIFWLGDIHLKKSVDGGSPTATGATEGYKQYWDGSRRLRSFRDQCVAQNPDFVLHLGDTIDHPYLADDFKLFTDVWNTIPQQKELTLGNHDLPNLSFRNEVIESIFGYDTRTENAQSKFNQSVKISNGNFDVRVITLDAQLKPDGNHISTMSGFLQDFQRSWVINELTNCPEKIALICLHYPVHSHFGTANEPWEAGQKEAYVAMLETIKQARPDMTFRTLFAHEHGYTEPKMHNELGHLARGVGAVCALDYVNAKYNVVKIFPNGEMNFGTAPL